jgi:PKD repeat protein
MKKLLLLSLIVILNFSCDENVNNKITANFEFSPQINLNNTIEINFTNTSQNSTTYFWDFGDGNSSTVKNPTHKYTNAGFYKVILLAQDHELKDVNADGIINISDRTLPMDTISKTITIN